MISQVVSSSSLKLRMLRSVRRIANTHRFLSTAPLDTPPPQDQQQRLPNDVHERNAQFANEAFRVTPFPSNDDTGNTTTMIQSRIRHDWTKQEIAAIYHQPLHQLIYHASTVHRQYWDPKEVQQCTLLSIKTGGCTEDCKYCSQSSRYKTHVKPTPTLAVDTVLEAAARAKAAGSTRFCMGAAWRELGNKKNAFQKILDMVQGVKAMDLEVCATLGMLTAEQAQQLHAAGLTAYNHNLDTSPEYYPQVTTTRSYDDRLQTLAHVRAAGIAVCSGGILGLGEEETDRIGLLHVLATLPDHPESVPINALVAVEGTPMGDASSSDTIDEGTETSTPTTAPPDALDMTRMIATARIVLPRTMVRLSAGRLSFTDAEQCLMFQVGANSIFNGDTLLTTANPAFEKDKALFARLGLQGKPAYQGPLVPPQNANGAVVVTHTKANEDVQVTQVMQQQGSQAQQQFA